VSKQAWGKAQIKQIKTVLFDLDGTLTNPKEGIIGSIQYALKNLSDVSFHDDDLVWCIGPPLQESFAKLLKTNDSSVLDQALAYYRELFVAKGMFQNHVYQGIPELLEALKAKGYSLFVATSKPHVYAKKIVQHFDLDSYFNKVYGPELDGTRANKAELIAHILETEQLDPSSTVMIGDRKHDMLGASKNKLEAIGVLWGFGSQEELEQHKAKHLVKTPEAILDCLA